MIVERSSILPLPLTKPILRDRSFYRGVLLIPLLEAVGFLLMVATEPDPQVCFFLQTSFIVTLLAASLIMVPKTGDSALACFSVGSFSFPCRSPRFSCWGSPGI